MKKKISVTKVIASIVIILFVLMNIVSSTAFRVDKEQRLTFDGDILYVGGSGPNNYTTIQGAIDDAFDGDTVFVFDDSSPYDEYVTIDNSINLIGENRNSTIISGEDAGVLIESDDVKLIEFTIVREGCGLVIYSSNNIISKNIFKLIEGTGSVAIYIRNSHRNIISNNLIFSNNSYEMEHADFYMRNCNDNIISNNTFIRTSDYLQNAIELTYRCGANSIENNFISGYTIGVYLSDISNVISNNYITDCNEGINIDRGFYNNIINNDIISCDNGIVLESFSWFNEITNNNFINFNDRMGYFLRFCFMNTWDGNYWDGPQEPPYKIKGIFGFFIPWSNYDYNPAQEPYDIG